MSIYDSLSKNLYLIEIMDITEILDVKKMLTATLTLCGGIVVISVWNRVRFYFNYKTLKVLDKRYIDNHYEDFIRNNGYASEMSGRRLHLRQQITSVDKDLLKSIENNLRKGKHLFFKNKTLAERTSENIKIYLELHEKAESVLHEDSDSNAQVLSSLSRQMLELCMANFFFLNRLNKRLTETWDITDKEFISSLYARYNKEQNMTKLPTILNRHNLLFRD
ncbi:hypothetical protein [Agarivorans gilvus]|uniref:hypothetical protein n=1 Tax=Agarivorans gilvus TaxID=680279 RepID=UPI0012EDA6CC|nr:hypothetical protein [Agarivorans gilvus]